MREGSGTDRALSTFSIAIDGHAGICLGRHLRRALRLAVTGLSPLLAEWGWIDGKTLFQGTATSAMDDITFWNFTLPVMTIALYGIGYIARMTRASMTEVMTAQYIRTARLKGVSLPQRRDASHALRNALIAPFTVIMLQFPWLLNGVVIVETLFNYKGFGWTLVAGGGQQRHRPAARLFGRGGGRRAGDAADLRHRLCLPQPAHPAAVRGRAHGRSVGCAQIILGDGRAVLAGLARAGDRACGCRSPSSGRLGLYGQLFDSPVGMVGFGIVLFWVFTAIFARHDRRPSTR